VATRDAEDRRPVVIMAEDEGRLGRISDIKRCWAPKSSRPIVPRQIVHEWVYIFAAICPLLGRLMALPLPYANRQMMTLFLRQVAVDFQEYFIVMVVDQAKWHIRKNLQIPDNLRLLPLPPGSPERNPTEHLWEDLRENELANHLFDALDQVEGALSTGIKRLASQSEGKARHGEVWLGGMFATLSEAIM
jgi:DDE superfamily endonuclease